MLILEVFLTFTAFGISHCQKNEATLYDQYNQQGNHITVSLSSDLKWVGFDNKARSVCVSGLMLFYTQTDFIGDVEYVYGGEQTYCTNLDETLGKVISVRYPGTMNDIKNDSLTLYQSRDFKGRDRHVYGDLIPQSGGYYSLIVTGGSNWTVFDGSSFSGNGVCLVAPNPAAKSPSFLASPSDIPGFDHVIYSGYKGCDDPNMPRYDLLAFSMQGP